VKTFALVQGDLVPAAGGYLLYDGPRKIHQDLSLALRETYGTDQFHQAWGSILPNMIGQPLTATLRQEVLAEVNRVINNYITVQNSRIVQDNATGSVSALTTDDVVTGLSNISVQQIFDALVIKVGLRTISRQDININQVIS
jgi:phage baseplate assembly protein W